jgi:hypothetical protein
VPFGSENDLSGATTFMSRTFEVNAEIAEASAASSDWARFGCSSEVWAATTVTSIDSCPGPAAEIGELPPLSCHPDARGMTTEFVSMKSAAEAGQHKTSAVNAARLETIRRMYMES